MEDRGLVKVCIDSQCEKGAQLPDLLKWCNWYFESNYEASASYPDKVVPLPNGNSFLLGRFGASSSAGFKDLDFCFVVRMRGGRHDQEIEHNLRLLEALTTVNCRKYLLAYLIAGRSSRRMPGDSTNGIP